MYTPKSDLSHGHVQAFSLGAEQQQFQGDKREVENKWICARGLGSKPQRISSLKDVGMQEAQLLALGSFHCLISPHKTYVERSSC